MPTIIASPTPSPAAAATPTVTTTTSATTATTTAPTTTAPAFGGVPPHLQQVAAALAAKPLSSPKRSPRGPGVLVVILLMLGVGAGVLLVVRAMSKDSPAAVAGQPDDTTATRSSTLATVSVDPAEPGPVSAVPAVGDPATITDGRVSFLIRGAPPRHTIPAVASMPDATGGLYLVADGAGTIGVMVFTLPPSIAASGSTASDVADALAAGFARTLGVTAPPATPVTVNLGTAFAYRYPTSINATATIEVDGDVAVVILSRNVADPNIVATQVFSTLTIDRTKVAPT